MPGANTPAGLAGSGRSPLALLVLVVQVLLITTVIQVLGIDTELLQHSAVSARVDLPALPDQTPQQLPAWPVLPPNWPTGFTIC